MAAPFPVQFSWQITWFLSKQSKEEKSNVFFGAPNGLTIRHDKNEVLRKERNLFFHPSFGSGNKRMLAIFSELFFTNGSHRPLTFVHGMEWNFPLSTKMLYHNNVWFSLPSATLTRQVYSIFKWKLKNLTCFYILINAPNTQHLTREWINRLPLTWLIGLDWSMPCGKDANRGANWQGKGDDDDGD